jgi:predicted nucleotidyltransferase component of viral defense system
VIPRAYITEWANYVPWKTNEQIEQDLIICRTLLEIFSDEFLALRLAFRGGTALHKLCLSPQSRYSEDIDLVQRIAEPFGSVIDRLKERLQFLGEPQRRQKEKNNTLLFRFDSEFPLNQNLRLKIETNCKEHFSVLGFQQLPYEVKSTWITGSCNITTYKLEELLGTKLRALYQRRKGRDWYDLYKAIKLRPGINKEYVLQCYHVYIKFVVKHPPNQKLFLQNMEAKLLDDEFLGDIEGLIRPGEAYNQQEAYELVKTELIEKI